MISRDILLTSGFFQQVSLKKGEILFDEWEKDPYLYIISQWELCLQKSTKLEKWHFKTLWNLKKDAILWEGSLTKDTAKEVRIIAVEDTELLRIESQKDIARFVEQYPQEGYELLLEIIKIWNARILQANKEVTANYEISRALSRLQHIDMKAIYSLLETFESILWVDQIVYIEKNTALDEYYKLRYNSLEEIKVQNIILHFPKNIYAQEILETEKIVLGTYTRCIPLLIGENQHGYLLIWKHKNDFLESEEKLLQNIAVSFVGVIHQKEILQEQKNKLSLKDL